MNALITFGCSWTNGKASCYPREGMSEDEFSKKKLEKIIIVHLEKYYQKDIIM